MEQLETNNNNIETNPLIPSSLSPSKDQGILKQTRRLDSYGTTTRSDITASDITTKHKDTLPRKARVSYRPRTSGDHNVHSRRGALWWEDISHFKEGTIPHSVVVATVISIVCGIAIYLYYTSLFYLIEVIWHTIPEKILSSQNNPNTNNHYWNVIVSNHEYVWIPFVIIVMSIGVGASVVLLGEPGDLAYTIKCVHEKAYVEFNHMFPMIAASIFSIIGAGSLGPEAPVVAMCACLSGYISVHIFHTKNRNVIRKHTLMGMAGALSAFFGEPLGGSLFALEVNSRFGIEYFEHMIEAIFCGVLTLSVFRFLSGLEVGAVWVLQERPNGPIPVEYVFLGFGIGVLGAIIAYLFTLFHYVVMKCFDRMNLLDNRYAIIRAFIGAIFITTIGLFIPHTLFWGEEEFQVIVTSQSASALQHVFPTSGLIGFEIDCAYKALLVGIFKLVAVSFTIAGGYRGGFIFPSYLAGAAFGRALVYVFPQLDNVLVCLCFAASINTALTKTSLATTLILVNLSNEGNLLAPVLAASLTSLFLTSYMPFIKTQVSRKDIDTSLLTTETTNWLNATSKVLQQVRQTKEKRLTFMLAEAAEAVPMHVEEASLAEGEEEGKDEDVDKFAMGGLSNEDGDDRLFKLSKVTKMGWFG